MIKSKADLIIWDLDGLLSDSYDAYLHALIDTVKKEGKEISENDITGKMMATGIAYTLTKFLGERDDVLNLREDLGKLVVKHLDEQNEVLCPYALEALQKAKDKGNTSALVSNATPHIMNWVLENHLKFDFDSVVPRSDESKEERIQSIIKRENYTPKETVMIDDTIHGMKIAKGLGCEGILVLHEPSWQHKTPEEEKPPKDIKIVYSLKDIEFD